MSQYHRWLFCVCGVFAVPVTLAEEMPVVFQADYVLKADATKPLGLVATYIDKPQWQAATAMGATPQPQSQYASFGFGPSIDINSRVQAYGVVGAATTLEDSHVLDSAPLQALTLDSDSRMYGVGMNIRPSERWYLNMQYQNAQLQSANGEAKQVNYFNLSMAYWFR